MPLGAGTIVGRSELYPLRDWKIVMNLSSEQQQAVEQGQPVPIVLSGTECIVIRKDIFEQSRQPCAYDSSDWTDEELAALAAQTFAMLDNPEKIQ